MLKNSLRLGTRNSSLAIIQAEIVRDALLKAFKKIPPIEIVTIQTSGDWNPGQQEQSFIDLNANKGFFTKEIEENLLAGNIDMAVHSMKDVPTQIPEDLIFAAILERADPRDAFLSPKASTLDALPNGARIGTSSLRRRAQVLAKRPDTRVIPLRGNVDTRLRKLDAGEADATILAVAGLQRLNAMDRISSILDTETMLPSAGQGAIGVQIRENDEKMRHFLTRINARMTFDCVMAERAVLRELGGTCHMPIAALAEIRAGDTLELNALVARLDGAEVIRTQRKGPVSSAVAMGEEAGEELRKRMPCGFLA